MWNTKKKSPWKIYVKMMCRCKRWSCHHCSLKWSQIMRCLWNGLNRPHCGMTSLLIGLGWQPSGNLLFKKSFNVIPIDIKAIKLVLPIEFHSQSDNDSIWMWNFNKICYWYHIMPYNVLYCHCVRAFLWHKKNNLMEN